MTQSLPPQQDVQPDGTPCPCCNASIVRVEKLAAFLYGWYGGQTGAFLTPGRQPFTQLPQAARRQWIIVAREALEAIA